MSDLMSRPYKPDPAMACERCVFGRGEHTGEFLMQVRDEFLVEHHLKPRPGWHREERFGRWLVPDEEFNVIFRTILRGVESRYYYQGEESAKLPIESAYYYRGELIRR